MTAAKDHRFDDPRAEAVQLIPLRELWRAPWNARKSFDPVSIAELRASIEQHGVQVPLIVRLMPREGPEIAYEIVAGHRRFEAALHGGTKSGEVPCIVRVLDDQQARELGLVDNLQREDVPPMEEAAAFEDLLKTLGSIAAVAAKVGKEQSYIAKRLKLCTLTVSGCDALREGLITVDHALLLARLGADDQDAAVKWCVDRNAGSKTPVEKVIADRVAHRKQREDLPGFDGSWRTWEPETVQSLKTHIASEAGTELNRAPWSLDDATLTDAPACSQCPQNTKANAPLFGDLLIGEATCTDGGCFKEKTQAFVRLQSARQEPRTAEAAGQPPVPGAFAPLRVSWKSTATAPRMEKDPRTSLNLTQTTKVNLSQTFKAGQWTEAKKKSCEHVRAAVTVDWSDANNRGYMGNDAKLRKPGEIIQVCVDPKCKAHPKDYAKPRSSQGSAARDPKAEAQKEAKRKAAAIEESKLRMAVASEAVKGVTKLPVEAMREIVANVASRTYGLAAEVEAAIMPGFKKTLKTAKTDSAEFAKAVAVVSLSELAASEHREASDGRAAFLASVKRLGWTGPDPWKKTAAKAQPAAEAAKPAKKSVLSVAAKKRIAAAQKKRWGDLKKEVRK